MLNRLNKINIRSLFISILRKKVHFYVQTKQNKLYTTESAGHIRKVQVKKNMMVIRSEKDTFS